MKAIRASAPPESDFIKAAPVLEKRRITLGIGYP